MTDPRDVAQAWVQQYADRVFRLAYALLGERIQAEDAAQESLYHIARWCLRHPEFQVTDAWVYQVTRNAVRDLVRSAPPAGVVLTDEHGSDGSDEPPLERIDVERALARLASRDREVLVLFYYLDLSTKEMAGVLRISETAVRIRLSRARQKFKTIFEGFEKGGPS